MRNKLLNMTASGGWDPLVAIPYHTRTLIMQARTAVDISYRYAGTTESWTIKSGDSMTLTGNFDPADLEIMAGAEVIIEIDASIYERR